MFSGVIWITLKRTCNFFPTKECCSNIQSKWHYLGISKCYYNFLLVQFAFERFRVAIDFLFTVVRWMVPVCLSILFKKMTPSTRNHDLKIISNGRGHDLELQLFKVMWYGRNKCISIRNWYKISKALSKKWFLTFL